MSKWIKKEDKVLVIAGNERGKVGSVVSRKGDKVIVQGLNIRKKHAKRKSRVAGSDILEMEMPIHISNVQLCNADEKPIRLKARQMPEGGKELFYLDGGKEVIYRQVKKSRANDV